MFRSESKSSHFRLLSIQGRRWRFVVIVILAVLCTTGCVRRRMTIRTNVDHIDPSGALVYIDDYEIGTTPISTNFTYYGTRKIRLVKEGYETLTVMQPISPPWWQITPLDFVTENLVPGELRDRRTLCYQLRPQLEVPSTQLRGRAEELRSRGRAPAAAVPAGFTSPVPVDTFPPPSTYSEPIPTPAGQPTYPVESSQPQVIPGYTPSSGTLPQQYPDMPPRGPSLPAQPQGMPTLAPSQPSSSTNAWALP